ncbi:MAG TPA: alpha-amylase family glycosyl hydrolase [Streptosporangiaceae bacterium]|nr:alpha-amylase family glycosyl hydrolase [Streptosporangiaceae bacterium]
MDAHAAGPRWWHGATLYQIYIRSWLDSDGDGYGDLPGVIAGLDYLAWLGVDGVWLSPTMPSPDHDWGYDVSDYLGVHPQLGTMADLDRLVARAGQRGMRVLLDLVPNHTSSAHPWFVEARSARGSAHRSYYVWADPAADGGPPNNWLSATGASAWTFDDASGQYYLHNFLDSQPDLNWWEPAVHAEFDAILRFWFDRGIAGFRIDVAHGLYKDAALRDDPSATGPPSRITSHFGLTQAYSANRPESHGVYRDWRAIAETHAPPRLLLGETWVADLATLASYHGHGDELQLTFNFPFIFADFTAEALSGVVARTLAALPAGECPVWTASNHDISRFPTRWCGGDEARARLALLVLATLPGTLVLYYGDEVAMTDVDIPPAARRDEISTAAPGRRLRDRSRTPMPWDASPSGGFTTGDARPWLPLGDHAERNVAGERADRSSTLRFCRDLLALRRAEFGGAIAAYTQLPGPPGVWAYRAGDLVVAANFGSEPAWLGELAGPLLLSTARAAEGADGAAGPGRAGRLGPWEGVITRAGPPGR